MASDKGGSQRGAARPWLNREGSTGNQPHTEDIFMKSKHMIVMFVALAALSFLLTGCPKKDKMMGSNDRPVSTVQIG